MQQNYTNLDIHVGQSYSFLVTMDQNASSDYYIVASSRFVNESLWTRVTGVAVLHYSNSKGKASGPLPDGPNDVYDKNWSLNQALSIRFVHMIFPSFLYVLNLAFLALCSVSSPKNFDILAREFFKITCAMAGFSSK